MFLKAVISIVVSCVFSISFFCDSVSGDVVHIFNVGCGNCSLIDLDNAYIIIDAGGEEYLTDASGEIIYKYTDYATDIISKELYTIPKKLIIILTHTDMDHLDYLVPLFEKLQSYSFDINNLIANCEIIVGGNKNEIGEASQFKYISCDNDLPPIQQYLDNFLGNDVIKIARSKASSLSNSTKSHINNLIIKVKIAGENILFMGDASGNKNANAILQALTGGENIKIYIAPHHGSNNNEEFDWINNGLIPSQKNNLECMILSTRCGKYSGIPCKEALEALNRPNTQTVYSISCCPQYSKQCGCSNLSFPVCSTQNLNPDYHLEYNFQ